MPDKPKILFIDDETHWSESYHRQLWSKFDVVTARTSEESLIAISKQRDVDVVILDIMIPTPSNGDEEHEPGPERSGLRLLEELRSRASLATQFVIYSSYLSDLRNCFASIESGIPSD
jgi:CheY-like chemotaxis protein